MTLLAWLAAASGVIYLAARSAVETNAGAEAVLKLDRGARRLTTWGLLLCAAILGAIFLYALSR